MKHFRRFLCCALVLTTIFSQVFVFADDLDSDEYNSQSSTDTAALLDYYLDKDHCAVWERDNIEDLFTESPALKLFIHSQTALDVLCQYREQKNTRYNEDAIIILINYIQGGFPKAI